MTDIKREETRRLRRQKKALAGGRDLLNEIDILRMALSESQRDVVTARNELLTQREKFAMDVLRLHKQVDDKDVQIRNLALERTALVQALWDCQKLRKQYQDEAERMNRIRTTGYSEDPGRAPKEPKP